MTLIFHTLICASLESLAGLAYFLIFALIHFLTVRVNLFGDSSFLYSFVICCYIMAEFYPNYSNFIRGLVLKLYPDVFEYAEDEETDATDDDVEYDLPHTFKAVYYDKKIDAYFNLVSRRLCGCNQLLLFKDVKETYGAPLDFIGVKPPFKVKRNEIVIEQADYEHWLLFDICRNYGMVSFVCFVDNDFVVYKINRSAIKPYIYDTIRDKELYRDIKESLISSTIDEITTDNGDE